MAERGASDYTLDATARNLQRQNGAQTDGAQLLKDYAQRNNAESTAVNTDPAKHTAVEQRVIDEYQGAVDEKLRVVLETYQTNPKPKFSRHSISNVSEKQAADASSILGGNYSGYVNAINTNGVMHILKEHGADGTVDHSMGDMNDLARIGYVLDNYDNVSLATYESGDQKFSREFRDKNNAPAPMLVYSKKVNGTYYVVEAIPDTEYKKFWVVSAYMNKKGSGTQAPNAQSPGNTPDASLASSPPKGAQSFKTETPNDVESGYRDNTPSDVSITDSPENSNSNFPQGVGAAERGFAESPYAQWQNDAENLHNPGENAARNVSLPTENLQGRRTMKGGQTVMESANTPEYRAEQIADLYLEGRMSFDPKTNPALAEEARRQKDTGSCAVNYND